MLTHDKDNGVLGHVLNFTKKSRLRESWVCRLVGWPVVLSAEVVSYSQHRCMYFNHSFVSWVGYNHPPLHDGVPWSDDISTEKALSDESILLSLADGLPLDAVIKVLRGM